MVPCTNAGTKAKAEVNIRPKFDDNGECKRLQNEEFHSSCRLLNVASVIKSKREGRLSKL